MLSRIWLVDFDEDTVERCNDAKREWRTKATIPVITRTTKLNSVSFETKLR